MSTVMSFESDYAEATLWGECFECGAQPDSECDTCHHVYCVRCSMADGALYWVRQNGHTVEVICKACQQERMAPFGAIHPQTGEVTPEGREYGRAMLNTALGHLAASDISIRDYCLAMKIVTSLNLFGYWDDSEVA